MKNELAELFYECSISDLPLNMEKMVTHHF